MAPSAPDQEIVINESETLDDTRDEGAAGEVKAENEEDGVDPDAFTAVTMTAYEVPPSNSVNVADVTVSEKGVTDKPSTV